MQVKVFATTRFEGFHRWPASSGYLGNLHRHLFHVRAEKKVEALDREIEFIELKRAVNEAIQLFKDEPTETWSCETWAVKLLEHLDLETCEVSEDGENGAVVCR